jgi:radical SAM-linked protein
LSETAITEHTALEPTRLRIIFSKTEAMRYTSHLDLHRTWERTIRRANLPLAYSQGYNPHPRINLASALPLGFTSDCEIVDIWLEEDRPLEKITSALDRAAPPGVKLQVVRKVDLRAPTLQTILISSDYTITFLDLFPELDRELADLLKAETLERERRGKHYDLRPLILAAERLSDDDQSHARLQIRLSAMEGATGRPEEVIEALGALPTHCRVHRTALNFSESVS